MADANVAPSAPVEPTTAAPSEATPSNTLNEAPQAPVASTAPPAEDPFDRFVNANGGREVVLTKMKQAIGDPVAYARSVLGEQQVPTDQPTNAMPEQPTPPMPQVEQGFVSPLEIAINQYGKAIANEYSELGDYVAKAEYMKEMADIGIKTVDAYGNINDNAIRKFLTLKQQASKPPVAPQPTLTSIPTVEYYNVPNDTINSREDALAIIKQNSSIRGSGANEHPLTKQAQEYLKQYYASQAK